MVLETVMWYMMAEVAITILKIEESRNDAWLLEEECSEQNLKPNQAQK